MKRATFILYLVVSIVFQCNFSTAVVSYDATIANDIFTNQNPPPTLCSKKRLLILDSDPTYFEGTGSIMKVIMFGIAEAMHSNRTLVWGRFIPELYSRADKKSCYNPSEGGLYDCFFKKLSTCSMKDVTSLEIVGLGQNGYDDTARVVLQQPRRGLAAYVPPKPYRAIPDIELIWPTSLAAYVFRLKIPPPDVPGPSPLYCAHVRHGDVRALSYVYKNKAIYDFEDYFDVLVEMSMPEPPGTIFFATDSIEVEEKLEELEASWEERMSQSANYSAETDADGNLQDLPVTMIPNIVTTDHFRTEFGSHVAAARGGCMPGAGCAFPWQHIQRIQEERKEYTQSDDVYMAVLESIDDMLILSKCQKLVGSASSHMSSFSMFLTWGEKRDVNFSDFRMLDMEGIVSGQYESSFLLGTYNAQEAVPPEKGYERYGSLQMRFGDTDLELKGMPDLKANPDYFNLPTMSYELFDKQADKWQSRTFQDSVCKEGTDLQTLINHGVDHSKWHPNVALHCWNIAMKIIKATPSLDPVVEEVVSENILAVQEKRFKKYITKLF